MSLVATFSGRRDMRPAERDALEALAGRPLLEHEAAQIEDWLPDRRDDLIAAMLSVARVRRVSHFASERGILDRYPGGPIAADALLSKVENFAVSGHALSGIVKRAVKFLAQSEGIDLGSDSVGAMVGQLADGGVITAAERDGLMAMATQPAPISTHQVSDALNRAQGLLTLEG